MSQNPQLDLAFNFVQFTDKHIFLTGKAGTGKTTFLHNLKKISLKRMAVVAPTGVAAINAGGVTIHSLFQLPFGPFIPGSKAQQPKRFSKEKINLIKGLDLLVIDEISMVRADTLDSIDDVLRRFKDHQKPFGGVQLLMIGDLHQLSPVVKDDDWQILKDYYPNLYFFNSLSLKQTSHINIELRHIYRQTDSSFIGLLNRVRENRIDEEVLAQLNQRYIKDFNPSDDEGYITLTTHNNSALEINERKLAAIKNTIHKFKATIEGDFPEYAFPTVQELEIKLNSQVMFVKNDPSRERLFYNGKIGKVTRISNEVIYVKCPDDISEIAVSPLEWNNINYELDAETKEVKEKIIGRFIQHPLKLAWAITIHKSQGLTFEKAIIDANAAFAHGQVYVALSRCKSFEGMVLRSQISSNAVRTDGTVATYTKHSNENAPGEAELIASKIAFQQSLIFELFDFDNLKSRLFYFNKIAEENYSTVSTSLIEDLNTIKTAAANEVYAVADTFKKQLSSLLNSENLPEENTNVQERLKKACTYFAEKIESTFSLLLPKLDIDSDNKAVKSNLQEALDNLSKEAYVKLAAIKEAANGFNTISYLKAKVNAEIDYLSAASIKNTKYSPIRVSSNIPHPELYIMIKSWRDDLANENDVPVFHILQQKSLLELLEKLPSTPAELEMIKGIGKIKVRQYGEEILSIISEYCSKNNVERIVITIPLKEEKIKADTKKVSFDLFKEGKTIQEIAQIRSFSPVTIEGHLAHYVTTGEISVFDIVSKIKVAKIMAHLVKHRNLPTGEIKNGLGNEISYSEIKAVMNHLSFVNAEEIDS